MQIQINTDHNIEVHEAFAEDLQRTVKAALAHCGDAITRVEVHLSDENGPKTGGGHGADKRCLMEARLQGRQPLAVTHHAPSLQQAVGGAADKMARLITSTLGRAAHGDHAARDGTSPADDTPP